MINSLFSTKVGGTQSFQRSGKNSFGWDSINDLYKREISRSKQQLTRMVPKLKELHCLRDSWTKLNVFPAKIMQVNDTKYSSYLIVFFFVTLNMSIITKN